MRAASFLCLLILASLLQACASRQDEYLVGGGATRLSKVEAEDVIVQRALQLQVKPPLDSPLQVLHIELPHYPPQWKRLDNVPDLRVRVEFSIAETGVVTKESVVGPANSELAERCLNAVRQWRFAPAVRGGKPVELRLGFNFVFTLEP